MNGMGEHIRRKEAWCKATGLVKSNARYAAALPWVSNYQLPAGFDHTRVYYSKEHKLHVIVTEPYHTAQNALLSLQKLAAHKGKSFAHALGEKGRGLWYPGSCFALLAARAGSEEFLLKCVRLLPDDTQS